MRKAPLAIVVLITVFSLLGASENHADAFCNDWGVFGVELHCDDQGHPEITGEGLSFFRPRVRSAAIAANVGQDRDSAKHDDQRHVDSCRFQEASTYINGEYDGILASLHPGVPDSLSAIKAFGRIQHTVQDFYAHSNWFQLLGDTGGFDPSDLVAGTTGYWPELAPLSEYSGDIMIGELPTDPQSGLPFLPNGYEISEPLDSDVPTITTPSDKVFRALITGWNPPGRYPDDSDSGDGACVDGRPSEFLCDDLGCPRTAKLVHGDGGAPCREGLCDPITDTVRPCLGNYPTTVCLNRDEGGRPEHGRAFNFAVVQTQFEWCRLLHLLEAHGGHEAASIPMALWVGRDQPGNVPPDTPHPFGTACERDFSRPVSGPIGVTVSVASIQQLAEVEDPLGLPLPLVSSFVLYRGDFRDSTRTLSEPIDFDDAPRSGVVAPRLLCLNPSDTLVMTVQGWGDIPLDLPGVFGIGEYDAAFEPAFEGVTLSFPGPTFGVGSHTQASGHISATFDVALESADVDADGLADLCGESFYGTVVGDPDTDDDGLLDGDEVHVHGTDPTKPDTDDDGLSDFTEITGTNPTNPTVSDTDGDGLLDGVEDANHNGGLDADETDPNKFDTDADALSDGCEVTGGNPTFPLDPDSDDDGLLDGEEDSNQDCALDPGETNPNDADSDDDGLLDGIEVDFGTDPLDPDSDDDGIPDGEDTEWLQTAIGSLPEAAFKDGKTGLQTSMNSILDDVEASIRKGKVTEAIKKLLDLRRRVDGCGTRADNTDWIVECAAQLQIRQFIDLLILNLQT